MYYVYCLVSGKKKDFHYYGFTSDIEKRLEYHRKGKVRTTKKYLPIKLYGYRRFNDREKALAYEKKVKRSAKEREKFKKEIISG